MEATITQSSRQLHTSSCLSALRKSRMLMFPRTSPVMRWKGDKHTARQPERREGEEESQCRQSNDEMKETMRKTNRRGGEKKGMRKR